MSDKGDLHPDLNVVLESIGLASVTGGYRGYGRCEKCDEFHPPGTECPPQCSRCGQRHYRNPNGSCLPPHCAECYQKHYLDEPCQRHEIDCALCGQKHWDNEPCPRDVSRNMGVIDNHTCDVCSPCGLGDETPKTVLFFEANCGGDSAYICMEHLRQVLEKVEQGVVGDFFPRKDTEGSHGG